jgi:hypothetical protein
MMGGTITVKGDVGINAGIHMGKGIGRKDTPPELLSTETRQDASVLL